ncbi:UNVERIFIED_ORG: gas vesicle protein [Rhizobium etli]
MTGIEENVSLLREEVSDEKQNAHESRSVIHRRLDEQGTQINLLDKAVVINAGVDAQVRDELKSIKETVQKNHETIQPTLEEWKRLKTLGYGVSGLIAFAGLTIGGMVAYASDGAATWIKHWLKIS